jgi:hypothetical protein
MIPVPPLSKTYLLLEKRGGFTAFLVDLEVTFFMAIAGTATTVATSVCSVSLLLALFGMFKTYK